MFDWQGINASSDAPRRISERAALPWVRYLVAITFSFAISAAFAQPITLPGTIKGDFQVTPGGAAVYSIPIAVPKGTAGLQPALSLQYSSQGGMSEIGLGWSIGGLSSITRGTKNILDDGVVEGVTLGPEDIFVLDGQRLVALNKRIADTVEYRTQVDNYSRVRGVDWAESGPQRFISQTKGGLTLEFGGTADSRVTVNGTTMTWLCNKITDSLGNYIVFEYESEGEGYSVVKRIRYTGNDSVGLEPYATVEFVYEPVTAPFLPRSRYISGQKIVENKRLTAIQSNVDSRRFRSYEITAVAGLASSDFIVRSIVESGEHHALRPTTFQYTHEDIPANSDWVKLDDISIPVSLNTARSRRDAYRVVDADRDGRIDILYSEIVDGTTHGEYLKGGASGWEKQDTLALPVPFAVEGQPALAVLADLVGDERLDIVEASSSPFAGVYEASEDGFTRHPALSALPSDVDIDRAASPMAFDLNGDGTKDLLYASSEPLNDRRVAYLNGGSSWDRSTAHDLPFRSEPIELDSNCDGVYELGRFATALGALKLELFEPGTDRLSPVEDPRRLISIDNVTRFVARTVHLDGDDCIDLVVSFIGDGGGQDQFYLATTAGWSRVPTLGVSLPVSLVSDVIDVFAVFIDLNADVEKDLILRTQEQSLSLVQATDANGDRVWRQIVQAGDLPVTATSRVEDVVPVEVRGSESDEILVFSNTSGSFEPSVWEFDAAQWRRVTGDSFILPVHVAKWDSRDVGTQLIDLDNDGLLDLVSQKRSFRNTGRGWNPFVIDENDTYVPPKEIALRNGGDPGIRIIDINGDMLPDFVYAVRDGSTSTIEVYLNSGGSWIREGDTSAYEKSLVEGSVVLTEIGVGPTGTEILDLNGDGLVDIIASLRVSETESRRVAMLNERSTGRWRIAPNYVPCSADNTVCVDLAMHTQKDATPVPAAGGLGGPGVRQRRPEFLNRSTGSELIDLNGDSLPDILFSYRLWNLRWTNAEIEAAREEWRRANPAPRELPTVLLRAREGDVNPFSELRSGALINTGVGWVARDGYILPYRLDGEPELTPDGEDLITYTIDHNGDGLIDLHFLERRKGNRVAKALTNTGTAFIEDEVWNLKSTSETLIPTPPASGDFGFRFVDVNGDSRLDIVQHLLNEDGSLRHQGAWINTGAGWTAGSAVHYPKVALARMNRGDQGTRYLDLNGDGLPDLVQHLVDTKDNKDTTLKSAWRNNATRTPLVSSIADGHNTTTFIRYETLSYRQEEQQRSAYSRDSGESEYPLVDWTPPSNLVRSTQIVIPGYSAPGRGVGVNYYYSGFRYNVLSGQSAGFAEFREENSLTRTYKRLTLLQRCQIDDRSSCMLVGKVRNEETGAIVSGQFTPLQVIVHNWRASRGDLPPSRAGPIPIPIWNTYLKSTETTKYAIEGRLTARLTEVLTYDFEERSGNVGNVVRTEATLDDAHITVTENRYRDNIDDWLIGRLSRSIRTRSSLISDERSDAKIACFEYYPSGQLRSETSLCDHEKAVRTEYEYDAWGNRAKITVSAADIEPRTTHFRFDSRGRLLVWSANPLGHTQSVVEYNEVLGLPIVSEDSNQFRTTVQYDDFGRVVYSRDHTGVETTTTRDFVLGGCEKEVSCHAELTTVSSGAEDLPPIRSVLDAANRIVREEATGFEGRPIASITVYGVDGAVQRSSNSFFADETHSPTDRYELPPAGVAFAPTCSSIYEKGGLAEQLKQQRKATDQEQRSTHWTHYYYDGFGRLSMLVAPDGGIRCTEYDTQTTVQFDAYGRGTVTLVDRENRPLKVVDSLGGELTYRYDVEGRLKQTINVDGSEIVHGYNALGEKFETHDPDLGYWQYKYNSLGELVEQTDAKNQTSVLIYDLLGRLKERRSADSIRHWEYDRSAHGVGALAREYDDRGFEESYLYDEFGRLEEVRRTVPEAEPWEGRSTYSSTTQFDAFGRPQILSYPSGFVTRNGYDENGFLRRISAIDLEGAAQLLYEAVAYDAEGRVTNERYGSSVSRHQVFEGDSGNLVAIRSRSHENKLQHLAFEYDLNRNLVRRSDTVAGDIRVNVFDRLDRVIEQWSSTNFLVNSYAYGANGDVERKSDYGDYKYDRSATQPFHGVSRVVHGDGAVTEYVYDRNGNMTRRGTAQVVYDAANRVTSIRDGRRRFSTFEYTPSGDRYRHDYVDGRRRQHITYFGTYERIKEVGAEPFFPTADRVRHRHAVVGPGGIVATVEYIDWLFAVRNDRDVERRRSPDKPDPTGYRTRAVAYVLSDNLGTANVIVDETGEAVETLNFDAWGQRLYRAGTDDRPYHPYRKGFTGHEHLDNLSLIHMNGRVYDPALGRFISADPNIQSLANAQNYNRYSYALNNPYKYVDPSGFFLKKAFRGLANAFRDVVKGIARAIGEVVKWVRENWREIATVAVAIVVTAATGGIAGPVIAGMIGGFAASATGTLLYGGSISDALSAGLKGAAIGGITAGLTSAWGGVGGMADGLGAGFEEGTIGRALGHGVVGGVGSEMQGDDFMTGFGSAAFTHYASSAANVDGIEGFDGEKLARVSVDAAIGGTASVIGGGKFANGAMSAAFQRLYNAEPHREFEQSEFDRWLANEAFEFPQEFVDFAAGFGDGISLGGTWVVRHFTGANAGVNFDSPAYGIGVVSGVALTSRGYATGAELRIGRNFRLAPWGNRAGGGLNRFPHYHRRSVDSAGVTRPGGGIGRHRPYEKKTTDTSIWDRF